MQITNNNNIPFALQIWLASDNYDRIGKEKYISATTLLKPVKQIILGSRINKDELMADLDSLIPSKLGDSIHAGIEAAWLNNLDQSLKTLGLENLKGKFAINPKDSEITDEKIPVYIEQRTVKQVGDWSVGGKFDFIASGILHDFKTTSAWTYVKGSRIPEFVKQGSIYRWLNQDKVKEDFVRICYVFTDWSKAESLRNESYPKCRCLAKEYPLMLLEETEKFIKDKLTLLDKYWDKPEKEIPECTDEELWRTETVYKYYKKPESSRATKVFKTYPEAIQFQAANGGVGKVVTVKGEARACAYCVAAPLCQQRKLYTNY